MPHFKDRAGAIHFLDDASFKHLLPEGCVEITDAEASAAQKPTVDQAKAAKWESIKAERDRRKSGGVNVGTKWYHSDTDSRIQFIGLKDQARDLIASGQPESSRLQKLGQDIKWKTMDSSFVFLTIKHAFDIVNAVGDLDAKVFEAAETHKASMEASSDPASYNFSHGWPNIFAD